MTNDAKLVEMFQIEELEQRLEMKAKYSVSGTVDSKGTASATAKIEW